MRVLTVIGTRPEAIKMAEVVRTLGRQPGIDSRLCVTAQHRDMLDQVLALFELKPHHDLDLMREGQQLGELTARLMTGIERVLLEDVPDLVLVQGDTTTTLCAALAAFYCKIPVGHVEAGLRTHDRAAPWPEELNRQMVSRISDLHFAPTETARTNLRAEGIADRSISVTGNTVIDALLWTNERLAHDPRLADGAREAVAGIEEGRRVVLVTAHRRESFGAPMESICRALVRIAEIPGIQVVFPVHPNPAVRTAVDAILRGKPHILLIDPLDYLPFVHLMSRAHLVLTDSGGVQEEAPSLGKPVLVMRDVTERTEAIAAGTVKLVGTDEGRIVTEVTRLLNDETEYRRMAHAQNPYGDGHAAERIVSTCVRFLNTRFAR